MRPRSETLTGQELEIMKIVWDRRQATTRDVYESLLEKRKIAYTSVMTMMKILDQKGYLTKSDTPAGAYLYHPSQPKSQVLAAMVREFVDRVFNGAAEPLLAHLIEDEKLTQADLDEMSKLIRESKAKEPKP